MTKAWGRLKSLLLKFPNHEFSKKTNVDNLYARLPQYDREILNSSYGDAFRIKVSVVDGILLKGYLNMN